MLSKAQRDVLQWAANGSPLHGPAPDHQGPLAALTADEWDDLRARRLIRPVGRLPEPQDVPEAPYVVTHSYIITAAGLAALGEWQSGRFAKISTMFDGPEPETGQG